MNRDRLNLSFTLVAGIAAAGLWGCGTPVPAVVGYPGVDDTAANLTQLATPCAFVADGGVMNVAMAPDEYALIGITTNAALITGSGASLVNANPVTVNGSACSTATVTATKRINVTGSTGNETVIIDYLNGTFALGTAAAPGINIDLKAGAGDSVKIRGGTYDDNVWLATTDAGTATVPGQYAVAFGLGVSGTAGAPLVGVKGMVFSNVESLVVSTGPGNDTVLTGGKPDAGFTGLTFGLATMAGTAPTLYVYGGAGNDTVNFGRAKGGDVNFYGGTEADGTTPGTDHADFSLRTNPLTVTIAVADQGEVGEKVLLSTDVEVISGGAGDDTLACDVLACTLNGNAGDDRLYGGAGDDFLYGGAGNDWLQGKAGNDLMSGGAGIDLVSYWDGVATRAAHGVTVTLPATGVLAYSTLNGDRNVAINENDQIGNDVEAIWGSAGADTIQGNDADNILAGAAGADTIKGGAGNDLILMGADGDLKDDVDGEAGEDTVDFSNGGSLPASTTHVWVEQFGAAQHWVGDIFITLPAALASSTVCGPAASGVTSGDYCTVTAIENVIGGDGVDTITGNAGDNRLEGGPGSDVIDGAGGNDILAGGAGTNNFTCGAVGNTIVISTSGTDSILTPLICH